MLREHRWESEPGSESSGDETARGATVGEMDITSRHNSLYRPPPLPPVQFPRYGSLKTPLKRSADEDAGGKTSSAVRGRRDAGFNAGLCRNAHRINQAVRNPWGVKTLPMSSRPFFFFFFPSSSSADRFAALKCKRLSKSPEREKDTY